MSHSHGELKIDTFQSNHLSLNKMQSTMDEEFIFYSDDEDEKVFYTNIAKKKSSAFKSSPSLSPLKVHQSSMFHNTTPAATRLDWSATSYSSLLNYTTSFQNPPVNTNYVAPKPITKTSLDSLNFSAITNSNKHNPYQTDPIHKQISNLIGNTKSTHNFNSTPLNSIIEKSSSYGHAYQSLNSIIEKSSSYGHAYQSLILNQHRTRSPNPTPSMNYSSDSFSSESSSRTEAPNFVTNTSLPYNPLNYTSSLPKSNNSQLPNSLQIAPKDPWPVKAEATSPQARTTTPPARTMTPPASHQLTRATSWSQIASKPATPLPTPPAPRTATPSPPPSDQIPLGPPEYHRGPKVDPRWPIEQQIFLGPIPVIVTWDEIRAAFYNKIDRKHVVHTYVQSKAVNEVVYGMIVFDKATTAKKILKEGPISVKRYLIRVSPMCQR